MQDSRSAGISNSVRQKCQAVLQHFQVEGGRETSNVFRWECHARGHLLRQRGAKIHAMRA